MNLVLCARAMAFVAFALAVTPLAAKSLSLSAGTVSIAFDIPDNWESARVKRGLEIKSGDGEVFLWIESYPHADLEKIKAEHGKYFAQQGVSVTGEPKINAQDFPGYSLAMMDIPATWKGKPTVLRYIIVEPKASTKNPIMLSYWASPEGDKTHDGAMQALVNSLAAGIDKAM